MSESPVAQLGQEVRDIVTGLTGIAYQEVRTMTGMTQLAVQPKLKEGGDHIVGAIPDSINVDIELLAAVGPGVSHTVKTPAHTDIEIGNEVVDVVTGFKGIVTQRNIFINGCVFFIVTPKQTAEQVKKNQLPDGQFLATQRLVKLSDALATEVKPRIDAPVADRTNGPMSPGQRNTSKVCRPS